MAFDPKPGDADICYRTGDVDALHMLGILAHQVGRNDLAVEYISQALRALPEQPHEAVRAPLHNSLGNALHAQGHVSEAMAHYQEAIRLQPTFAEAQNNLGTAFQDQGRLAEAIACYREALRLRPAYAEACHNLGAALHLMGHLTEASTCFQEALRLRPDYVYAHVGLARTLHGQGNLEAAEAHLREALRLTNAAEPDRKAGSQQGTWEARRLADLHNHLGAVLHQQGKSAEALTHIEAAVRKQPDNALFHVNLGLVLQGQGRLAEAMTCFQQALCLQPECAEAHYNLGNAWKDQWRWEEAVSHYQQAVRFQPDHALAHNNLGAALQSQGRLTEAIAHYQTALRLQPNHAATHNNLGLALQAQGRLAEAMAQYHEALRLEATEQTLREAHDNLLFCMNHDPDATPAELFEEHRQWAAVRAYQGPVIVHRNPPTPERRLRIGYVSADFRNHPVAWFMGPVLAAHQHDEFQVFCYADVPSPDAATVSLQQHASVWRSTISWSDDDLARCICDDAIDILVDLAGHTAHNRLGVFARRPAPVQVTYLGYPSTTGLTSIDYRLTDAVADPPGEPTWSTEELVRLPGTFCCFGPPPNTPEPNALPAISNGRLTFGSLHKLIKLNARVLDLWCRLLHALPDSRMLLAYDVLAGDTKDFYREQFRQRGIDDGRLDIRQAVAKGQQHFRLYHEIDVVLDTFPWSGHATTCEALWMGVPIVSLRGNRHAGRMTASILTSLGLTDLVANTTDDFVAIGTRLASAQDRLVYLRTNLRSLMRAAPLCDGPGFTRGLENAYRTMWRRWCETVQS